MYDDALRPFGLRSTQFSILQALSKTGPKLQGELAELLALDGTAFTRAAQLLRKRGWVATVKGTDKRERWVSLSDSGTAELARARPAWESVQQKVRSMLGEESWSSLTAMTTAVANLPTSSAQRSEDDYVSESIDQSRPGHRSY
jgi:DNA-binding MarR family transcriptional regulator